MSARVQVIAVGTRITARPPHRSERAEFPHSAPTLGAWRETYLLAMDGSRAPWGATARRWPPWCATARRRFGYDERGPVARGGRRGGERPPSLVHLSVPRDTRSSHAQRAVAIALALQPTRACVGVVAP